MRRELIKCALIRTLHTICQTALATIPTTAKVLGDVDWLMVLSSCLLAGIISFIKSIFVGMPEVSRTDIIVDNDRCE